MTLSTDERRLLELIAAATEPVAMSSFYKTIHEPDFDREAPDDDPALKYLALSEASVSLWQSGLVEVVHPANGVRPDLVVATGAGRAALTRRI